MEVLFRGFRLQNVVTHSECIIKYVKNKSHVTVILYIMLTR